MGLNSVYQNWYHIYSKQNKILIAYLFSAVPTGTSFVLASISFILIFSGMQMFKPWFGASQLHTFLGGYLGSLLFVLSLTAIGNLETFLFGKNFQVKLFPEGKLNLSYCMFIFIAI